MIVPLDAGHVTLVNCTGITAHNLNLTNNSPGILLWSTTNSIVTLCNITKNYGGILLQDSSSSNSIAGNNIENNDYAGIELVVSSGNSLFHNNIINNINETVTIASWGNIWDDGYPSGGNYWSDYNGTDLYSGQYQNETGSDGIGDTPYTIDTTNIDWYPLMQPYSLLVGDINLDRIVNISDAILAATAFGSHPGDPNWNSQADLNHDNEVDIFDVIILANNFGKH
jgi:parallel beta-helix repeat protein